MTKSDRGLPIHLLRWASPCVLLLLTVGGWWIVESHPIGLWSETVARSSRDLPAFTVIDAGNAEEVEVFAPGNDAIGLAEVMGRALATPVKRGTVFTDANLLVLPLDRKEWSIISVPLGPTVAPLVGDRVALIGVDSSMGSVQGAATSSMSTASPTPLEPLVVLAEDAFVMGVEEGKVVLAISPEEVQQALPYLTGEGHRAVVLRTIRLP